jgi:hypothetical protein
MAFFRVKDSQGLRLLAGWVYMPCINPPWARLFMRIPPDF